MWHGTWQQTKACICRAMYNEVANWQIYISFSCVKIIHSFNRTRNEREGTYIKGLTLYLCYKNTQNWTLYLLRHPSRQGSLVAYTVALQSSCTEGSYAMPPQQALSALHVPGCDREAIEIFAIDCTWHRKHSFMFDESWTNCNGTSIFVI